MPIGDALPAAEAVHGDRRGFLLEDIARRGFGGAAEETADLAARIEVGVRCALARGAACGRNAVRALPLVLP